MIKSKQTSNSFLPERWRADLASPPIPLPIFLYLHKWSHISLHQSHYLSPESQTDVNNSPLPVGKWNDALQLVGRVWCQIYHQSALCSLSLSGGWDLTRPLPWQLINWASAVQFLDNTLRRAISPYLMICLRIFFFMYSCMWYLRGPSGNEPFLF